jgi:hypothetical protein
MLYAFGSIAFLTIYNSLCRAYLVIGMHRLCSLSRPAKPYFHSGLPIWLWRALPTPWLMPRAVWWAEHVNSQGFGKVRLDPIHTLPSSDPLSQYAALPCLTSLLGLKVVHVHINSYTTTCGCATHFLLLRESVQQQVVTLYQKEIVSVLQLFVCSWRCGVNLMFYVEHHVYPPCSQYEGARIFGWQHQNYLHPATTPPPVSQGFDSSSSFDSGTTAQRRGSFRCTSLHSACT